MAEPHGTRPRPSAALLVAALFVSIFLLVRCGGGDDDAAPSAPPEPSQPAPAEQAPEPAPPPEAAPAEEPVPAAEPAALGGDPEAGLQAYLDPGFCARCHILEAAGSVQGEHAFSDLDESLVASAEAAGLPLEEFILESIVDPGAYVGPEWQDSAFRMAPAIAETLTEDQIRDIVAFLVQAVNQ